MLVRGENVRLFEKQMAENTGMPFAYATSSGSHALIIALKTLNIGSGDEVILPSYLCFNVAQAILEVGAKPVFCDIGKHWNMTPETVSAHFTEKTKAIIVVHMFGIDAGAEEFREFGVPIIEDACQAIGVTEAGTTFGSKGDFSFFSFNAIKGITTGMGGMLLAKGEDYVSKAQELKEAEEYWSSFTEMQGALGVSQLKRLETSFQKRKKISDRYLDELPSRLTDDFKEVIRKSVVYRFPLRTENTNFMQIRSFFEERGVAVRKGVDSLSHQTLGLSDAGLSQTLRTFETTVSIPIRPQLTEVEQGLIVGTTLEAVSSGIL